MSSIHIIYKTGKTTIPVLASNTMMEVLKKGCQYYKIDDSRFQLMYGQQSVNLSLPYRLSGIPNLSRVTIVEKKGASITTVKIAIQMDDGKRYQSNFKTNQTLWDILVAFETTEPNLSLTKRFNDNNQYIEPIVTILNRQISTIELLQKSSLASLNVSEASLIKLTFKQTDRSKDEVLPIIESYQSPSLITPPTTPTESPTTTTVTSSNNNNNSNVLPTTPKVISTPTSTSKSPTTTTITPPNNNNNLNSPINSETSKLSMNERSQSSPVTSAMDVDTPLATKINNIISQGSAFGVPLTVDNEINNYTNNDFATTTTTTTNSSMPPPTTIPASKVITMDPKDRELLAYIPSESQVDPKSIRHNEKMTDEDIKRLVESNKRVKKEKEEFDSVLRTKAMREREAYKKLKNFSTTIIRVVFPGLKILEMKFLLREKISNLVNYINQSILSKPIDSIYLYTTPPHQVLNPDTTFLKEGLFPRAKIFLGVPQGTTITFNDQVDQLFSDALSNNNNNNNSNNITEEEHQKLDEQEREENEKMQIEEEKQRQLEDEQEKERQRALRSMFNNEKEGDAQKKQIPKWFTSGKKN